MSGHPFLITDTETSEVLVHDDLDDWLHRRKGEVGDFLEDADNIFEEISLGNWDLAASHLGFEIVQDPDLETLSDRQWTAWIAHHLDADRSWTNGDILIRTDHRYTGKITPESWPKTLAIQVCGVHADRERSWRAIGSWEALREATYAASEEEERALAEIAREREVDEAQWGLLRDSQAAVVEAESELARRENHRDRMLRRYVDEGVSIYKLSQVTGITQPRISRLIDRAGAQ